MKQVRADYLIAPIPVGTDPTCVAYDSNDGTVYVNNILSNDVSVIDTKTDKVIHTIHVGTSITGIAYDSNDGRVYVANPNTKSVSVIATAQHPSNTTITSSTDGNNNIVK